MDEEALSIYFGLQQGSRADIEVIANSLLELSKAIQDISYFLDPGFTIKVEIVRGADGSLKIDLIIKLIKAVIPDKKTFKALPFIILCMLIADSRQYVYVKILDHFFTDGDKPKEKVSEKEVAEKKNEIEKQVQDLEQNDVGGVHIRNFYGNLYLDPSITGVGASPSHNTPPDIIIRRNDFPARAHLPENHKATEVRVLHEEMRVTLISPILIAGHRKWKFKGQMGEFSAPINDNDFQRKFLAGQTAIKLQAGIDMDVVVSVLEHKINGVWQVVSREIIEVKGFRPAQHQGSLDFGN